MHLRYRGFEITAMSDLYGILRVSPRASNSEIKSAYRRLARKLHPDINRGAVDSVREFRKVAHAYEILGNPKKRAEYDYQQLKAEFTEPAGSVFSSDNLHAKQMREMIYRKRYKEIMDRMNKDERAGAAAVEKSLVPMAAFYVGMFLSCLIRPHFFAGSGFLGRLFILTLAVAASIHLFGRLREAVDSYSYPTEVVQDYLAEGTSPDQRRFSTRLILGALIGLLALSYLGGLAAGALAGQLIPEIGDASTSRFYWLEVLLYPPIFGVLVELVQSIAVNARKT